MPPPWAETQTRVVIEFLRRGGACSREIVLRHNADQLPPQLYGRVASQVWAALMTDCNQLALTHPYVVRPSAGRCCGWLFAAIAGLVLGCCCLNGDGGEYSEWIPQVEMALNRHRPTLMQSGVAASLQSAQGSYWIQLDVTPSAVAIGQPAYGSQPLPYPATGASSYPGPFKG